MKQLSGLISDKIQRPIIINGKLVTIKGRPIYVKRASNYHVSFFTVSQNRQETEIEDGDGLLDSIVDEFNEKYKSLVGDSQEYLVNLYANIDTFTQSVVIRNGIFDFLMDSDDANHLHDGTRQFKESAQKLISEFVRDYFVNHYEIYTTLMNRRLMGAHMPVIIKGHLVAGLYQPLVVQTKHIESPLKFGELSWFMDYLNAPQTMEEHLERVHETSRGLDLSVIAMSDLQQKFETPLVRELNRIHWMYMLYLCLLRYIDVEGVKTMMSKYAKLYNALNEEGPGVASGAMQFFFAFSEGIKKIQTTLAVRY